MAAPLSKSASAPPLRNSRHVSFITHQTPDRQTRRRSDSDIPSPRPFSFPEANPWGIPNLQQYRRRPVPSMGTAQALTQATIQTAITQCAGSWDAVCNTRTPTPEQFSQLTHKLTEIVQLSTRDRSHLVVASPHEEVDITSLIDRIHTISISTLRTTLCCRSFEGKDFSPLTASADPLEIVSVPVPFDSGELQHILSGSCGAQGADLDMSLQQARESRSSIIPCLPPELIALSHRITKIVLHSCNLVCIPSFIVAFERLSILDITSNQVTTLPDTLLQLPNLSKLITTGNPLVIQAHSILDSLAQKDVRITR